jgi:predicted dehydrogenase
VRRLRVGVVGSGIGASHIEAYRALPELYEVAALCDIDAGRGGAVAEKFGIPITVGHLDRLLESDLDLIDICTPSGLHQAQAIAVLDAGKHAVIEKPVGKSLAEVDAIVAAETASAGRACPIFQYRFGHGLQKLAHLRGKGFAASASVATAETHWYRGEVYYGAASWRGTFDGELGGCLTTHAIHIHDILCEVLGPIASVHARASNRLNGNETEDMAVLSLAFASGAFASSSVTLGSRQEMSRLRFCFDDLVAESGLDPYNPGHDPWIFPHDDEMSRRRIEAALADFAPLPERFVGQFHRLHAALTGGGPLPVTLADARRSVELLTAAYYSAMTGEAVALPLAPDHPFYAGWREAMKEAAMAERALG